MQGYNGGIMLRKSLSIKKSHDGVIRPQITSLIDVMTILLVFLMKSFSVEGNIITPANDLTLPVSCSKETPGLVTTLEITQTAVMAEGEIIIRHDAYRENDSLFIPQLAEWLSHHGTARGKEIMLQADRTLPFELLKRIMFTCSKAGRDDFTILVQQEG